MGKSSMSTIQHVNILLSSGCREEYWTPGPDPDVGSHDCTEMGCIAFTGVCTNVCTWQEIMSTYIQEFDPKASIWCWDSRGFRNFGGCHCKSRSWVLTCLIWPQSQGRPVKMFSIFQGYLKESFNSCCMTMNSIVLIMQFTLTCKSCSTGWLDWIHVCEIVALYVFGVPIPLPFKGISGDIPSVFCCATQWHPPTPFVSDWLPTVVFLTLTCYHIMGETRTLPGLAQ